MGRDFECLPFSRRSSTPGKRARSGVQTPSGRRRGLEEQAGHDRSFLDFVPALADSCLTTCRGDGLTNGKLEHSLSGEPAGDQGTVLGKPPGGAVSARFRPFVAFLMLRFVVESVLFFHFLPEVFHWLDPVRRIFLQVLVGAGFPGFRHKNQGKYGGGGLVFPPYFRGVPQVRPCPPNFSD